MSGAARIAIGLVCLLAAGCGESAPPATPSPPQTTAELEVDRNDAGGFDVFVVRGAQRVNLTRFDRTTHIREREISPDGRHAFVEFQVYGPPSIGVYDLRTTERMALLPAPEQAQWSWSGDTLHVTWKDARGAMHEKSYGPFGGDAP